MTDLSDKYPDSRKKLIEDYERWAGRAGVVSKELIDRK